MRTLVLYPLILLPALLALAASGISESLGADWPSWRGPSGNGVTEEAGWSPAVVSEGKVLWRANVGKGHATFAVAGDRVLTVGNTDNQDTVFCFDAGTGEVVWKHSYPCRAGNYPGPRATPTVDGDAVYCVSRDGFVQRLDLETGRQRWRKEAPTRIPKWGVASSAVVHGKLVVVNVGESGTAFDKETGRIAWSSGKGTPGYASPVPMKVGSTETFLIFSSKALFCVSARSGKVHWSFPWETRYDVNAADPVLVGRNRVFLSSNYGVGCALLEVGPRGARELWRNKNMKNHMASTVFYEGNLYGFDDGTLACLDAKDGSVNWTRGGVGKGNLIIADGKLVYVTERGIDLVVAEATGEAYRELARTKVFDGHTWTSPVLANGRIYCRNDAGDVACVDARE